MFAQDSGDGVSGHLELSGDRSDVAHSPVVIDNVVHLFFAQLSSSPTRNAAGFPRFSYGRSEEQLLGCDDSGCGVRVNLQQVHHVQ